jgi:predicted anti-sigma-YlaC factor YlaD
MSKHVQEWLNAYYDGELRGHQLHQVEEHLAECELCQKELESLDRLSGLLQEVPAPEFMPEERFASQVNLQLPHRQAFVSRKKIMEAGWWMIPVGLLAAWVSIGTAFFVRDLLSVATNLGLLRNMPGWLASGLSANAAWSAALGQFGVLHGSTLSWAEATEGFTRTFLPFITLQISIALLYLSWLAIWWAHHQRQGRDQVLEG